MYKFVLRLFGLAALVILWNFTQWLLSTDIRTDGQIIDRFHEFSLIMSINSYLQSNYTVARLLLIVTSLLIDSGAIFMAGRCFYKRDFTNILIAMVGLTFRQLCQFFNRLPIPSNMLWFDPGIPSLLVTYGVSNDFFFSGHTFSALLIGLDIFKIQNIFAKAYAVFFIILEISFVLITHGHYFMDVYAAIATYFMVKYFMGSKIRR